MQSPPFISKRIFLGTCPSLPWVPGVFFLIQALCGEPGKRGAKLYHTPSAVSFTLVILTAEFKKLSISSNLKLPYIKFH